MPKDNVVDKIRIIVIPNEAEDVNLLMKDKAETSSIMGNPGHRLCAQVGSEDGMPFHTQACRSTPDGCFVCCAEAHNANLVCPDRRQTVFTYVLSRVSNSYFLHDLANLSLLKMGSAITYDCTGEAHIWRRVISEICKLLGHSLVAAVRFLLQPILTNSRLPRDILCSLVKTGTEPIKSDWPHMAKIYKLGWSFEASSHHVVKFFLVDGTSHSLTSMWDQAEKCFSCRCPKLHLLRIACIAHQVKWKVSSMFGAIKIGASLSSIFQCLESSNAVMEKDELGFTWESGNLRGLHVFWAKLVQMTDSSFPNNVHSSKFELDGFMLDYGSFHYHARRIWNRETEGLVFVHGEQQQEQQLAKESGVVIAFQDLNGEVGIGGLDMTTPLSGSETFSLLWANISVRSCHLTSSFAVSDLHALTLVLEVQELELEQKLGSSSSRQCSDISFSSAHQDETSLGGKSSYLLWQQCFSSLGSSMKCGFLYEEVRITTGVFGGGRSRLHETEIDRYVFPVVAVLVSCCRLYEPQLRHALSHRAFVTEASYGSEWNGINTIITSLKALDEGLSSKNYVRKFLRALNPKWRPKVTTIEESKDFSSLALDELIGNLKVHEVVMEKDSENYRGKKERVKSIALKANKESSDDETSTSGSEDEEYVMAVRNFKNFFRRKGKFDRQPRGERSHFDKEMIRKERLTGNVLDAVIQIISLAVVQKHLV
ncbi:hypothetical protein Tco_0624874 [Tanacetum coccineum]|uniref:UBN2 domain-containing protein n=1 Tax=Tanacetum coccineum TaxID=301880 RepID=A0ABQ4WF59_9ASTR